MGYRIASFNMRNFGNNVSIKRDLNKIVEIILAEKFDIIAMQEILAEGKGIKTLLEHSLGSNWNMRVSDISYDSDPRGEQFVYIWNKSRIRLAQTKVQDGVFDKSTREYEPRILNSKSSQGNEINVDCSGFVRTPFYARFEPVNGGYFEFRLINVHLHFGNNTISEIDRRKEEYQLLTKEVFPRVSTTRRYGNNRQAITIALGDYNLNIYRPRGEAEKKINSNTYITTVYQYREGRVAQKIETVQDGLTTLKNPDSDEQSDDNPNRGYSQNYDHFTIDTDFMENNGIQYRYHRVDAVRKYCEDNFSLYREKISDHIPIVIEINF